MLIILVGIIIGLVLGLTGAGGSIFALPLLILLLDLSPKDASIIALCAVFSSAIFGTITRLSGKSIVWLPAVMFALVGSFFAPLGSMLNKQVTPEVILFGFTFIVLFVAYRMWMQASATPDDSKVSRAQFKDSGELNPAYCRMNHMQEFKFGPRCFAGVFIGASLTGLLSGLFGVGGGFIIVPTLMFLTGISIQQAVATSLPVITVVSLTALSSHFFQGNLIIDDLVIKISFGGLIGMISGILLGNYLSGPLLQKLFSCAMICLSVLVIARHFSIF